MSAFALQYARALQQVAREQQIPADAVRQQLADLSGTLGSSHELREFLGNLSLGQADKLKVLDAVAQRTGMGQTVRNFAAVLMDHNRLGALDDMIAEYQTLADAADSIGEAEITSAKPLAQEQRDLLEGKAGELAGTRVRVAWREDASLLGGAVIQIGSRIYDGSVRGQLEQMKQHLAGA